MDLLRSGEIQIFPGIPEFTTEGTVFVDGRHEPFSDVVLAMGFSERRFPLAGDLTGPLRDGPRRVARAITEEMRR